MKQSKASCITPSLKEAKKQFNKWRRVRRHREPIPSQLWLAAVNLTRSYSIHKVSRHLKLNYAALKQRVEAKVSDGRQETGTTGVSFIEIPWQGQESATGGRAACVVEMRRNGGDEMKISLYGEARSSLTELVGLFCEDRR